MRLQLAKQAKVGRETWAKAAMASLEAVVKASKESVAKVEAQAAAKAVTSWPATTNASRKNLRRSSNSFRRKTRRMQGKARLPLCPRKQRKNWRRFELVATPSHGLDIQSEIKTVESQTPIRHPAGKIKAAEEKSRRLQKAVEKVDADLLENAKLRAELEAKRAMAIKAAEEGEVELKQLRLRLLASTTLEVCGSMRNARDPC